MPRFSPKQQFLLATLVLVPVAVFFVARSAASWRPQLVGRQDKVSTLLNRGYGYLKFSPDEKRLVGEGDYQVTSTLWELEGARRKRELKGTTAVFSGNSRLVATYNSQSGKIFLDDGSGVKWHKHIEEAARGPQVRFSANDSQLLYHALNRNDPFGDLLVSLDVKTGKEIGKKEENLEWQQEGVGGADVSDRTRISYYAPDSEKPTFSFETSNDFDKWKVAPDGNHLWVSLAKQKRFDIRNGKTGRPLWSYSANSSNGDEFDCYPSWESGGKTLVTIENDTLVVRDAGSGKVLMRHKNNLPNPLKAWTFTKDGRTVYLMDDKGEIFRQRLH